MYLKSLLSYLEEDLYWQFSDNDRNKLDVDEVKYILKIVILLCADLPFRKMLILKCTTQIRHVKKRNS